MTDLTSRSSGMVLSSMSYGSRVPSASTTCFCSTIDRRDSRVSRRKVLVDVRAHALEQAAGAAVARILECGVRSPAGVVAIEDDVAEHALDVDDGDALADPLLVHHARRVRPHLEVVRRHEVLGDAGAEHAVDQLLEVLES